jgi:antitoxin component of RelBE/YafQ-DinJ toxin-antitoxin module
MNIVKVRKNFLLDKDVVEKAQNIILNQHKNLTEVINLYFKAIIKEPSILDTIEKSANKRTGSFIGMLDGKIGDTNYKEMKKESLLVRDI